MNRMKSKALIWRKWIHTNYDIFQFDNREQFSGIDNGLDSKHAMWWVQWPRLRWGELADPRVFDLLLDLLTYKIRVLAMHRLSSVHFVMYQHHLATIDQFDHPQRQYRHNSVAPDPKMHQDSMNLLRHSHRHLVPESMFVAVHFLVHRPRLRLGPNFNIWKLK